MQVNPSGGLAWSMMVDDGLRIFQVCARLLIRSVHEHGSRE